MTTPQDLNPLNRAFSEWVTRSNSMPWTQTVPGRAFVKVLWTGAESGSWAAIIRWVKGYEGPAHKHLAASHTFVLAGRLQLDDGVYGVGDYVYEPAGIVQRIARAVDDTEFLFISNGPILALAGDGLSHYVGWEEAQRLASLGAGTHDWVPGKQPADVR